MCNDKQEMTHTLLACVLWKACPKPSHSLIPSFWAFFSLCAGRLDILHTVPVYTFIFTAVPWHCSQQTTGNTVVLIHSNRLHRIRLILYSQNKQARKLLGKTAYICNDIYMCNVWEFVRGSYYCWTCSFQAVSYYTLRKAETVRARLRLSPMRYQISTLTKQSHNAQQHPDNYTLSQRGVKRTIWEDEGGGKGKRDS